ncbi:MAG: VOC family protein [Deltaproteobacteria bacterium]|nr:VOC family protein [Deltaproteobacteria bacterium]
MNIENFDRIAPIPEIFGEARQIAYIVDDIDEAIRTWHEKWRVGPFLVTRNAAPLSNAYYRGRKAKEARVHIAFAYVGEMQLELIELIGDTPSLYKEAVDRRQTSVHHYAVLVDDFPTAYDYALDNGFVPVVDSGIDGLARMSYVENDEGMILEVIEWNAMTRPYFNGIEERVKAADASQLIHEFELSELTPKGAVLFALIKFMLKKLFGRIKRTRRPLLDGTATA